MLPHDNTKGRRVIVLGVLITGTTPDPVREHAPGEIDATVLLDNAPVHVAKAFKSRRGRLVKTGVKLLCLPPRSSELNDIERVWRSAKYEECPR